MLTLNPPAVQPDSCRSWFEPDAGAWFETQSLAQRAARLALGIDERWLAPVAEATAGPALQPRSLLALLIYSYASGIFSSQAIAEHMHEDAHFRALCGNDYPDWHQLRRFRRLNRPLIQHCLEALFCPARSYAPDPDPRGAHPAYDWPAAAESWEPESSSDTAQEARARLNRAAQLDSMALDE